MEFNSFQRVSQRISDIRQNIGRYENVASQFRFTQEPKPMQRQVIKRYQQSSLGKEQKNSELYNLTYKKANNINHESSPFALRLENLIKQEALQQEVNPRLIEAIVKVESNGRVDAKSNKGAIGLMQLMPGTARSLAVNPYDAQENLSGGIRYLKNMARRFGDLDLALAAYNAGPKAVDKHGGIPPYKETIQYIKKIRKLL